MRKGIRSTCLTNLLFIQASKTYRVNRHPLLQEAVDIIVKTVPTEKIALLALTNKDISSWNIFEEGQPNIEVPSKVNLLILARIPRGSKHERLDIIEQKCKHKLPVSALLMTPFEFKILLSKGNPLAITVFQSNHWIFEERNIASVVNQGDLVPEKANLDKEITCWYKHARTFLEMAGSQQRFGEFGMAAFCLHQAAEQLLGMLTQAITGFRVGTHNLDKLLEFLHFFITDVRQVFKRTTNEERTRFLLLKSTYINFRYKTDFEISAEDIDYLMNEVIKLQSIAENVFRSKMAQSQLHLVST